MRNLGAIASAALALGFLAVAACGSSNVAPTSCADEGAFCLKSGAACGDTLPFTCPNGGVCCSPGSQSSTSTKAPTAEPAAH